MSWKALFGVAALLIGRNLSGRDLSWGTVQQWIAQHSNRENIGRGYAGGRLPRGGTDGFVELIRENLCDSVRISAVVVFDKRSGPVARQIWEAKKLDAKLEKMFGNNLRVRINV